MAGGSIDRALWEAYRETTFEVDEPSGAESIRIRVGDRCPALDSLLEEIGASHWAFVTAWNPGSRALPRAENDRRNEELRLRLTEAGAQVRTGRGVGADSTWEPEESFLAIGLARGEAVEIGQAFGQLAIVVGRGGDEAELVFCGG